MMLRSVLARRVRLTSSKSFPHCRAFSEAIVHTEGSIDVSGYDIGLSDKSSVDLYNESLHNFLSHQNDPSKELRLIRQKHKNVGMVNALLAFQMIRQPRPSRINEKTEVEELLRNLEESSNQGKLSERERYFASAAASFIQGNYLKSAALLESLFIERKSDIIALKLAQDCYMLAGDTVNTLGCVARWLHLFDSGHDLYGHLMGMFAMGLLENGRYSEAEEYASRAVNRTRGMDVWALHALLNTYQSLGRSAELGATINDHLSKHRESSIGLSILLFNKGCGLIQRGNYTGALRAHDEMVSNMVLSPDKEGLIAGSIADATFLLWLADINSPSELVEERWIFMDSVAGMWTAGWTAGDESSMKTMSPMNELCRSIAIGAAERCATAALPTNILRHAADEDEEDGESLGKTRMTELELMTHIEGKISGVELKAKSAWEWLRGITDPSYVKPESPASTETPEEAAERIAAAAAKSEAALEASALQHQSSLSCLKSLLQSSKAESRCLDVVCPSLLAMKPSVAAVRRIPESPDAAVMSDRKWAAESAGEPLSEAMLAFNRHDYNDASDMFQEISNCHILNRMGGTIVQRDIVKQTIIESLMRCTRLKEAEYLLTERTVLVPNDAQSWRRLASLYGRIGDRQDADMAHYTAWQLGIGQGGFGGPK